jgi:hypothetical protein
MSGYSGTPLAKKLGIAEGALVDIKVCAVDETWSGLKLVIRRTRRAAPGKLPRARERS